MATSPTLRAVPALILRGPHRSKQTSLTLFPTTAACPGNCESASVAPSHPETAPAQSRAPDAGPKPAAELVGIARLAASSHCADTRRGTEYFLLPVRSILNHCDSERVPFRLTVNPYRGCEFGCRYCYARYTHEYMELDGGDFERKIYVKQNAGALMERDLASENVWGEHIAIGTATDPYQPAEREFGATRAILERIVARAGLSVSITTKSNQVLRDLGLLQKISERSELLVNMSITTVRARLARLLEPRAPHPDLRFEAVRKLREAGVAAGVNVMPVLPGLTDDEGNLDALARAACDAGALWLSPKVLFLMPASQKQFLPFIEQKFPKLARRYREWYGRAAYAPEAYQREIAARVATLRERYGIGTRPNLWAKRAWESPQLPLRMQAEPR